MSSSFNAFCRRDIEDNSIICYNCSSQISDSNTTTIIIQDIFNNKVALCSQTCKKEFDIDNNNKIININKVFRLIEGGLSPHRETYYCSSRRLNIAKQQIEKQNINIVFQSTTKYFEDDFFSQFENNLDSTCYNNKRNLICAFCKKNINLDDDENTKELWGCQPDSFSHIMEDGSTVLIFCNTGCVNLSFSDLN